MSKKGVQYVKPEEPAFLKQFKQRVGYKEGPTIESKRAELERDSGSDLEDEAPSIVVLKKGDLTAEEVAEIKKNSPEVDIQEDQTPDDKEEEPPADGRIVFKKPTKRPSADTSELNVSSKKKKDGDKAEKKRKDSGKKVKNSSLLSFGDDEEDDE